MLLNFVAKKHDLFSFKLNFSTAKFIRLVEPTTKYNCRDILQRLTPPVNVGFTTFDN